MMDLESLRQLDDYLAQSGNDNDRVDLLIAECITMGIDTRQAIRDALEAIGRDPGHVVIRLNKNAEPHGHRRPWLRDKDGRYRINTSQA